MIFYGLQFGIDNVKFCRCLIIYRNFCRFISLSFLPQSQEPIKLQNIFILVPVELFLQTEGTILL